MEPLDLLRRIVAVVEQMKLRYAIVGSMASMYYSEARFTNDIDIVVDLTIGRLDEFVSYFPADQFYLSREAASSAIANHAQFNIIHPESGLKCDIIIPKNDALNVEQLLSVRSEIPLPQMTANYARPELVIIHKMLAYEEGGSDKHLRDIASMLKVQADRIDRSYIAQWAKQLQVAHIWDSILDQTEPN